MSTRQLCIGAQSDPSTIVTLNSDVLALTGVGVDRFGYSSDFLLPETATSSRMLLKSSTRHLNLHFHSR
jgi:hypothetical protein